MYPSCTIVARLVMYLSSVSTIVARYVSHLCDVPSTVVAVSEVSKLCDACPQYLQSGAWWYDISAAALHLYYYYNTPYPQDLKLCIFVGFLAMDTPLSTPLFMTNLTHII